MAQGLASILCLSEGMNPEYLPFGPPLAWSISFNIPRRMYFLSQERVPFFSALYVQPLGCPWSQTTQLLLVSLSFHPKCSWLWRPFPRTLLPWENMYSQLQTEGNSASPCIFSLVYLKAMKCWFFFLFFIFLPGAHSCLFKLFQLTSADGLWINRSASWTEFVGWFHIKEAWRKREVCTPERLIRKT